ncbi:hypothetical protein STEG23_037129, partial [Scotinomys teguina]
CVLWLNVFLCWVFFMLHAVDYSLRLALFAYWASVRNLSGFQSEFPVQVAEDFEMLETKPLHPLETVSLICVIRDHQKLEREARICRLLKHPNIDHFIQPVNSNSPFSSASTSSILRSCGELVQPESCPLLSHVIVLAAALKEAKHIISFSELYTGFPCIPGRSRISNSHISDSKTKSSLNTIFYVKNKFPEEYLLDEKIWPVELSGNCSHECQLQGKELSSSHFQFFLLAPCFLVDRKPFLVSDALLLRYKAPLKPFFMVSFLNFLESFFV